MVPASWHLSERKQHEKFQAVVYNIPENMTNASLFPNGCLHQFLLDSRIKSFKLFWNNVQIFWCQYSTPNFKNLRKSARISNADKSSKIPNRSNFSFSGFNTNNRKSDHNKTPKSGRSTKKIDQLRNNQSKKPDVKHLIAG
ncbi:hypothetical protein RclHR1_14880002 [Rhizophagus clarus]|uniref:Uncharacterized protein n=1 Tax=Rhizophagus clarus TaxID=94130 RepID=A0A2Z6R6H5_9GLOM|nr:hypothetical protein RclHR1_14880002 [Rhizophagus clarus]